MLCYSEMSATSINMKETTTKRQSKHRTLGLWRCSGVISRGKGVPIVKAFKNALLTALRAIFFG